MLKQIGILGTGSGIPQKILTNAELETMVDTSNEWIVSRTGIQERRIAAPDQTASSLAYEAAINALEGARLKPADIDLIICATVTPDMAFPATACLVQAKLGLTNVPAFDLSAGCSGFGYAISVAQGMLVSGAYNKALVIGVDLLSRITDYSDRTTCVLFGDGAGAVILGEVPEGYGILSSELGADGSGGEYLYMPGGGSLLPASENSVENKQHYIKMAGSDVFKFAVRIMDDSTKRILSEAGVNASEIDWVIPHQANIRIINAAAARLEIPKERFFVNLERFGNTSAASIGLALDELARSRELKNGDQVVLVGFGAGLTWSSLLLKWWLEEDDQDVQ